MKKEREIFRELHTPAELHLRETGEGEPQSRVITGYAILFNTPSAPLYSDDDEEVREVISPNAVTKELLDSCDIKMTMFHDRQLILARSRNGEGTLAYNVDEKGVSFEFEAPNTVDGDKAIELVKRGDLSGCSFIFRAHYFDPTYVQRSVERSNGKTVITYTVNVISSIHDFTLAADPAYPDTNCETEARELVSELRNTAEPPAQGTNFCDQVKEMRKSANRKIH